MPQTVTETFRMAGRKKEVFDRGRIEFKATAEWTERAMRHAERLGLNNLSAFIRFAVTQWMEEAEAANPLPKKK